MNNDKKSRRNWVRLR